MKSRRSYIVVAVLGLLAIGIVCFKLTVPSFVIQTGSMVPTLPVHTFVADQPATNLKKGDIITFKPKGYNEVITHTFIGYGTNGTILTKGDANLTPDVWPVPLTKADVVGKLWFAITPMWYLLVGGSIVFALLLIWLSRRVGLEDDPATNSQESTPVSTPV